MEGKPLEKSRNTTKHEEEQQETSQESLRKAGKSKNHEGVAVSLLQFPYGALRGPLQGLPHGASVRGPVASSDWFLQHSLPSISQ